MLLFQSISDMQNPNNRKSFLQGRIKIFKIRMNQGIKNTPRGRPGKCMFLCDFDWQLAIKHPKTYQSELPSIKCTVVFAKQTMAACRFILSPPPPYFVTSTSPKELSVDSPQPSVSLNVQINRTAKYACFAGYSLTGPAFS